MVNTDRTPNPEDNPMLYILQDYALRYGSDFGKRKIQDRMYSDFTVYLSYKVKSEDIKFFDYKMRVKGDGDYVEVRPENLLTALWFVNIFPDDAYNVIKTDEYRANGGIYKLNKATKKIQWIKSK